MAARLTAEPAGFDVLERARLRASQERWVDAVELYRRYLADNPDERGAQAELRDAEARVGDPPPPAGSEAVLRRRVRVAARVVGPGPDFLDLAYSFGGRWDLMLGGGWLNNGTDGYASVCPQARLYQGLKRRRSFVEFGTPLLRAWGEGNRTEFVGQSLGGGALWVNDHGFCFEYFGGLAGGLSVNVRTRAGQIIAYPYFGIGMGYAL